MRELMVELINATKERVKSDTISADELIETIKTIGYTEEDAVELVNDATRQRVIRLTLSIAARTAEAEELGAGHTVVTLL